MNTWCCCGHALEAHPGEHAGMCVIQHCECTAYRLRPDGAARPVSPPTLRDLIAAGKASKRPRSRLLAERIETSIAELVKALRAEREQRQPEEQRQPGRAGADRTCACPDCDQLFVNGTGLSSHRRSAHLPMATTDCPECGRAIKKTGIGAHRRLAHGIRKAAA